MHLPPALLTVPSSPPNALALALALTGCASGHDSRVQFIVTHDTVGASPTALKTLTQGLVSSHTLVDVDSPSHYRLVETCLVPLTGMVQEGTRRVIAACQMTYRPTRYSGLPDAATAALLAVMTRPGGLLITDPATGERQSQRTE